MKILIAHNHYQKKGGEDAVVKDEGNLLKEYGHNVRIYERNNTELLDLTFTGKIRNLWQLDWSKESYEELRSILRDFKPDIVHFHNTFFMMTPSVYYACKDEGVAVVQSLHNFRWLCVNALFFRDNHVCEDCIEKSLLSGIRHRCYHESFVLSSLVTKMIKKHREKNTLQNKIDTFVTATEFTKEKFVKAGIPSEKIMVKPHFVHEDPGIGSGEGEYVLYVGRVSQEKGVDVLIDAWAKIENIPLKIIGDGPLLEKCKGRARENTSIEFLGFVSGDVFDKYMRGAKLLVIPSVCYENFPRIVAEAYAYGVPIITSRLGSFNDLVDEGKSGLMFQAGNSDDLAGQVNSVWNNQDQLNILRQGARSAFEERFEKQRNYQILNNIYTETIDKTKQTIKG